MLDIEHLRQRPEEMDALLQKKGAPAGAVQAALEKDAARREALQALEAIRAQKNAHSAGANFAQMAEAEKAAHREQARQMGAEEKRLAGEVEAAQHEYTAAMHTLPNPPAADVPEGGEDDGVVLREVGQKPDFEAMGFQPRDHVDIAEGLGGLIDAQRGAKISGARFPFLLGGVAMLARALMHWAFLEIQKHGFQPVIPPFMTKKDAIVGTGFFDHDENYVVNPGADDLYLIGTSEVPLTSFHAGEALPESSLPRQMAGYSPCFRREAGSYGKDTRGMLRVHQFEKIEMVAVCRPEDSDAMHQKMLAAEEDLLQQLGLPYRVVLIAAGDLGNSAAKKFDCEAWLPGQQKYREMTSTSNCTDFQSRRLGIKMKRQDGRREFAHTLNGTAVSTRPVIAMLENFQQPDGSVQLPKVLWPFMGGAQVLRADGG